MSARKKKGKGGTPGTNETVLEMAAEITDPAMWAAMQLCKPTANPPKTIGEVRDQIAGVLRSAIDMETRKLRELILEADRHRGNGLDVLASAAWDDIVAMAQDAPKCETCGRQVKEQSELCSECNTNERYYDRCPGE